MKTMIFFCDIQGTITSSSKIDYFLLKEKIELLSKLFYCDEVIFSLISSDHYKSVLESSRLLYEHGFPLGKQFFDKGYIEYSQSRYKIHNTIHGGKILQIKEYLCELKKYKQIEFVCYADDSLNEIYKDIYAEIIEEPHLFIKPSSNKSVIDDDYIESDIYGHDGLIEGLNLFEQKCKSLMKK